MHQRVASTMANPTSAALVAAFALAVPGAVAQDIKPRTAAEAPARPSTSRARDLYYAADEGGRGERVGLKVRLYQVSPECDIRFVSPAKTFRSGERLRFGAEANVDGYLYIVQSGSSGRMSVLFPSPQVNAGKNLIRRGTELMVPGRGWFTFDATGGTEQVHLIVSRKPLDILRHLGADPATPSGRAPAVEGAEGEVLAQIAGQRSRDLVLDVPRPDPPEAEGSGEGGLVEPVYGVNAGKTQHCLLTLALEHRR